MGDKVFISYSHHDAAVALAICAAIEAEGRGCWIAPRDIRPSAEWAEQIIDGIAASSVMVLVFSDWSNRSPQVRREVERATARDMRVIPFRIEQVLPVKSLEYFLSTQHWFDAFDGRLDAHIAQLCALVRTVSTTTPGEAEAIGKKSDAEDRPSRTTQSPGYRDDDLAFVSRELAKQIGPIARVVVQRASVNTTTPAAMIDSLAADFTDARERAAFVSACRQRLGC